jgi:8-oxo-dGTP pyrophosphatase MutT (NUDIX family)
MKNRHRSGDRESSETTEKAVEQLKHLKLEYAASTEWKTIEQHAEVGAGWRFAAVLIPVLARNHPSILLTKRSAHLTHHPGQVSFPGGRPQENDRDVGSTALREAFEEIGLQPDDVQLLGCLGFRKTRRTQNIVVPVIGLVSGSAKCFPRTDEVDEIFEFPFTVLLNPELPNRYVGGDRDGSWYWSDQPQDIWGVTAGILVSLAAAIRNIGCG